MIIFKSRCDAVWKYHRDLFSVLTHLKGSILSTSRKSWSQIRISSPHESFLKVLFGRSNSSDCVAWLYFWIFWVSFIDDINYVTYSDVKFSFKQHLKIYILYHISSYGKRLSYVEGRGGRSDYEKDFVL